MHNSRHKTGKEFSMTGWSVALVLYVLGAAIMFLDMRDADRLEPRTEARFVIGSYIVAIVAWPLLAFIVIIEILRKEVL